MRNGFRFRYTVRGGHVHVRLFAGRCGSATYGLCGTFCMTLEEWDDFAPMVSLNSNVEVVSDL